jgi:hypothetical protein
LKDLEERRSKGLFEKVVLCAAAKETTHSIDRGEGIELETP